MSRTDEVDTVLPCSRDVLTGRKSQLRKTGQRSEICRTSRHLTLSLSRSHRPPGQHNNRIGDWVAHEMDRTNEGTPGPPGAVPPTVTANPLRVTPDNVVELGVLFSDAAARLAAEVKNLERDLRLSEPWLYDPVSGSAWLFFNKYFVDDENSFAKVVQAAYDQHVAHAKVLVEAAKLYGKTDELDAAIFKSQQESRLNG